LITHNESDDPDVTGIEPEPVSSPIIRDVRTELEKFAVEFEPGYLLLYRDYRDGARRYIARLATEEKEILRKELEEFINVHRDKSLEETRDSWFLAGARDWPRNQDMREMFRDFLQILSESELNGPL
jgi:hypothetical protein